MRPALALAMEAQTWLGKALWFELLTGVEIHDFHRFASYAACRMLEAQAEQAARLGLAGLIDTSVPLTAQVAAEIERGQ